MKKLLLLIILSSIYCFNAFAQDNPELKKIEMCIMQQHPDKVPSNIKVTDEKIVLTYNDNPTLSQSWDMNYVGGGESIYFELIDSVLFKEKRKGKRCYVTLQMKNKKEKVFVFTNCEIARDLDDALRKVLGDIGY